MDAYTRETVAHTTSAVAVGASLMMIALDRAHAENIARRQRNAVARQQAAIVDRGIANLRAVAAIRRRMSH